MRRVPQKGKATVEASLSKEVSRGRLAEADRDAALGRIAAGADFSALADADLVIEAVFEDRAIKEDVIRRAFAAMRPDAIFGSNTSTLPITSLAAASPRPRDFIGIHFFSPVEKMMLVEVIMAKKTGDRALAAALDFVRAIRKTPIVVNDSRGFYTSRVVTTYIAEGHLMLTEGIPAAMIENAARMAGMPVGPLALNDEVAIDLSLRIMDATRADLGAEAVPEAQYRLIAAMVSDHGRLGRKNGKGFYDYPDSPSGKKRLWPGLAEFHPPRGDPELDRRRRTEGALPRHHGARDRALLRGDGADRRARGRCRLDPRLRLPALHRRHAVLCRLHGGEALRRATQPAGEDARAAVQAEPAPPRPRQDRRDVLRPLSRRCGRARRSGDKSGRRVSGGRARESLNRMVYGRLKNGTRQAGKAGINR